MLYRMLLLPTIGQASNRTHPSAEMFVQALLSNRAIYGIHTLSIALDMANTATRLWLLANSPIQLSVAHNMLPNPNYVTDLGS